MIIPRAVASGFIAGSAPVPDTTAMVIIARWLLVSHTAFIAILCTADDTSLAITDDLPHCDWLGGIRLTIIWVVCHLAIVTLE